MEKNNTETGFRFAVAFSFPGEYRDYVQQVDKALSKWLKPEKVFYDDRFLAEIAGFDADTLLQTVYHDQSELIVVFLCREYEQKEWCCNVEWRAIRDLIKKRTVQNRNSILPLRFDKSEIPGVYSIDIVPNISTRTPQQTAELIWQRLQILRGESSTPATLHTERQPPLPDDAKSCFDRGEQCYKEQLYEDAAGWYRKAANQGLADAQCHLGVMYAQGRGVPQDDEEAVKWYRMAADQGDASAQESLGQMHDRGRGVPWSFEEAVKWFRMAADQGYARAQAALGVKYQLRLGVPQDDEEAVK